MVDFTIKTSIKLFIIDFGVGKQYSDGDPLCTGFCGTEGWVAPEVADDTHWNPKSADVWAMAYTLRYLADVSDFNSIAIKTIDGFTS